MNKLRSMIPGALSGAAVYLLGLLGGWDAMLAVMFTAMGLDYAAGLLTALAHRSRKAEGGTFSSSAAFTGLTRKLLMLAVVAVAVLVDQLLGTGGICRSAAIGFYTANEGFSILDNAVRLGVPMPGALTDALEKLRQRGEG